MGKICRKSGVTFLCDSYFFEILKKRKKLRQIGNAFSSDTQQTKRAMKKMAIVSREINI